MDENEISRIVVDSAFKVHTVLGPGLLESAYVLALKYELERRGLKVERERPITITYGDLEIPDAFRADLMVEGKLIVEQKSVETLADVHRKQLLTYLKLTGLRLGLLINFRAPRLKDGIVRIVNGLPDTRPLRSGRPRRNPTLAPRTAPLAPHPACSHSLRLRAFARDILFSCVSEESHDAEAPHPRADRPVPRPGLP